MSLSERQDFTSINQIDKSRSRWALVIINPVAGNSEAVAIQAMIEAHFVAAQWQVQLYHTSGDDDIATLVQQALSEDVDLIVVAGGDGTISSVVDSLMHKEVPLGIIPVGTGNVVAQELGLPLDPEAACRLLTGDHAVAAVDVMQVGEKGFISHLSMGLYSLIAEEIDAEAKRRYGRLAYLRSALAKIIERRRWRFSLTVDGQRYHLNASLIMVANAGAVGVSTFRWGEKIRPDDGYVDICVVKARRLRDYFGVMWQAWRGRHRQNDHLLYFKAKSNIIIQANRAIPVRADGEIIGERVVHLKVVPGAVKVIVPPR